MSTTAAIIIKRRDGSIWLTRVGSDGYPSHVGKLLKTFYSTPDRAEFLVSIAGARVRHIRQLRPDFPDFYSDGPKAQDYPGSVADALEEAMDCDYRYVWTGDRWGGDAEFA